MKKPLLVVLLLGMITFLQAEEPGLYQVNYNHLYRSPISFGLGYSAMSPLNGYDNGAPFNISELSLGIQYSPGFLPSLQPELSLGYKICDSQNSIDADIWDSNGYTALGGLRYIHKFSKIFEMGIGFTGGYEHTLFKGLSPDGQVVSGFALAQGSVYLGLNPSYNMSLMLVPSIRYQHSTDDFFTDMNGFLVGIGGLVSFRFGKDPDSADSVIKSLQFSDVQIQPLFAAMQSYYKENSFGSACMTNIEKGDLHNLVVTFYQPGYMDTPSIVEEIEVLESGESVDVDLTASFNKEIFLTEGITPLNGELKVSYYYNRRPVEQSYPISYDLYDKSSMIWDDDRKVAAFITPADSALQNYTSFIRQSCKDSSLSSLNSNLQSAMQIYHSLVEIGCIYQVDPLQPFATVVSGDTITVDTVSLPRNTLRKLTGDCDDLTVLYLSLLETLGIETAFITVPGHIYTAFNSGEDARNYKRIHPDRSKTISIDGKLWIPVEITLLGKSNFLEAWNKGAEEWNSLEGNPEKRTLYVTSDARNVYRPVGLKETDLGLQYGNSEMISRNFEKDLNDLSDIILAEYYQQADERGGKKDYNQLGIMLAKLGKTAQALNAFEKAVQLDKSYMSPQVNMANLEYMKEHYDKAVSSYRSVLNILEKKGKSESRSAALVNLNISKSYYALQEYEEAKHYYSVAEEIDPEKVKNMSFLASVSSNSGMTRASAAVVETVIFMEEEE